MVERNAESFLRSSSAKLHKPTRRDGVLNNVPRLVTLEEGRLPLAPGASDLPGGAKPSGFRVGGNAAQLNNGSFRILPAGYRHRWTLTAGACEIYPLLPITLVFLHNLASFWILYTRC